MRHFLGGELVVGRDLEARLCKTLLPRVKLEDLMLAARCRTSCSCVVKTVSHRKCAPFRHLPLCSPLMEVTCLLDKQDERHNSLSLMQRLRHAHSGQPLEHEEDVPGLDAFLEGGASRF